VVVVVVMVVVVMVVVVMVVGYGGGCHAASWAPLATVRTSHWLANSRC